MNYQTSEQLSEMRLHAMRQEYSILQELPAMEDLSFDERFVMIVNARYTARFKFQVSRLIRADGLREPSVSLTDIDYDPVRNLKKNAVAALSDCQWISDGSNLIVTGTTWVGKT